MKLRFQEQCSFLNVVYERSSNLSYGLLLGFVVKKKSITSPTDVICDLNDCYFTHLNKLVFEEQNTITILIETTREINNVHQKFLVRINKIEQLRVLRND